MLTKERGLSSGLSIRVFSWDELRNDPLYEGLVDAYISVFTRRGSFEWGESWTRESAGAKIASDLESGYNGLVALLLDGEAVAGFATAVEMETSALNVSLFPRETTPEEFATIEQRVRKLGDRVLFFLEFGIRHEYRGGLEPVNNLTDIVLEVASSNGVKHMILWTSRKLSRIYFLCRSIFMWPMFEYDDENNHVVLKANVRLTRFFFSWGAKLLAIFVGISLLLQKLSREQKRS